MEVMPHLKLRDDLGIQYAILPGDPARVERIAEQLEDVEELEFNREYKSIAGTYKGIRVLAVSTGIGGPSTGIAVEELARIGVTHAIRIGSCGALQKEIRLGDLILVQGAVRDEGTSRTYIDSIYPAIPDFELMNACVEVAEEEQIPAHVGMARSHDSFYTDREDEIDALWAGRGVLGCDMETAALFVIGKLRGVKTASVLNTVVEYEDNLEDNINNYTDGVNATVQGEKNEIHVALEALYRCSGKCEDNVMKNIFKTKLNTASLVLIPACIGINYLGKLFASVLKLPLWLDSIGTCIGGALGGPIIGAICGAANNLIYGFTTGDSITLVYALTSLGIGLVVGIMARLGKMEKVNGALLTSLAGGLAAVLISTPLNVIFWGGTTGNVWGDAVFAATQAANLPVVLGSFLDEVVVDVPDKIITVLIVFAILKGLPKKLTALYDVNDSVESLD